MIKIFSTKIHGMLDYGVALLLLVVPRVLGLAGGATTLLTVLGIGVIVYSLITRYELSIAKVLPMPGHLLLDGLGGLVLLGAAFWFREAGTATWATLLVFGLLELGAALMTDPVAPITGTEHQQPDSSAGTEPRRGKVGVYEDTR